MSLSRVKTWISGEVLTASDLNSEFNNLLNNPVAFISPWTGNMSAGDYSLTFGSGDAVSIYTATTAQQLALQKGTAGSPDTSENPLLKVERVIQIAKPGSADLGEQCAAIMGITSSVAAGAAQPVGVYGAAKSAYSGSTSGEGDACGIYGAARFTGSGVGSAIGGFFTGRRDTVTGRATGIEVATQNYGSAVTTYNSTGYSSGTGAWLWALGNYDSGVGIAFGNPSGRQFEVGLGFTGQVAGGKTGAVSDVCIRDDSAATTFMDIRGTHTNGIILRSGAGNMAIGHTAAISTYKLYIKAGADSGDNSTPLVLRANSTGQVSDLFRVENSAGTSHFKVDSVGDASVRSAQGLFQQERYSADANGALQDIAKSRNATLGSHTIVQANDVLGASRFMGSDGAAFVVGSQIFATVEGTPASGDIRADLDFSTRGADGLVSRMRIRADGDVYLRAVGSEMATTATVGYPHMPTTNGVTTGVPANILTGTVPFIFDRSNNKIGVYDGGWIWTGALS